MSNTDVTQPIVKPSTPTWLRWTTRSAVVMLVASILTGCYVETAHYHRPHHVIVVR